MLPDHLAEWSFDAILRSVLFVPTGRALCGSTYASIDLRNSARIDSSRALLRHHHLAWLAYIPFPTVYVQSGSTTRA